MTKNSPVHPTVLINGPLLKKDRKSAGHTQVSFAASCGSVSLGTIRRAEQGGRILSNSVARMTEVLGQPVARYSITDSLPKSNEHLMSIEGKWTGFFVESNRETGPYVVHEEATLIQERGKVTGATLSTTPNEIRVESYDFGRIYNNVLRGTSSVKGREAPYGLGSFMVSSSRGDDWLEGFTIWFDYDLVKVEASRTILVRSNSFEFDKYSAEAKKSITQDIEVIKLRKLMQSGYNIHEAYRMLFVLSGG